MVKDFCVITLMKQEENDGLIPVHVVHELIEHTPGGFALFYFNTEDGSPEQIITCDSPVYSLALQKHISDWSTAIKELNIEVEKHNIAESCGGNEEEEEA